MLGRIFWMSLLLCIGMSASGMASLHMDREGLTDCKVTLTDKASFQAQISKSNTVYVVSDVFDLNGAIIDIPEKVILRFTEGGGIRHGILKLSNGCTIIGGNFEFSENDALLKIYRDQKMNSPIVVVDASDITIDGARFFYDSEPNRGYPSVAIYGKELCCTNITIKQCVFSGTGIGVYSNVDGVKIHGNEFENSTHTLSVETLYDQRPYRHPKNVVFSKNTVHNTIPNLQYPIFWLSGVEGLEVRNNNIVTASDAIMLYCGDGNIAMERVSIRSNSFEMLKSEREDNSWKNCIMVRGKSFPYQKEDLNFGDNIVISNNVFFSHDDSVEDHNMKTRAISITWCKDITVKNNRATGFSNFVVIADVFKGYHESVTCVSISNNSVIDTYDRPILITEEVRSCNVKGNKLINCNVLEDATKPLDKLKSSVLKRNKIQVK